MVTPHSDDYYYQPLVNDFENQAIPGVTQLDLVGVLQVAMQLGRWHMWGYQAFGNLLFKQGTYGSIQPLPLFQCCFVKLQLIGLQATP